MFVMDNAQNGGIHIQASSSVNLPSSPILVQINGTVKIGGKDPITKTVYFIATNDPSPILPGNMSALSTRMWDTYCTLYSLPTGAAQNMYKSHLISLYGEIDFSSSSYNTINSLITTNGDSVLRYIPNVTSLNFQGCTSLTKLDSNLANNIDFILNTSLVTLNLNGCIGLNGEELDLSYCTSMTTLDTRNTSIGVTLPASITNFQLGSPIKVIASSPTTLGEAGTTYSMQSIQNLEDLELVNVNTTNVHGFTVFNTLYVEP